MTSMVEDKEESALRLQVCAYLELEIYGLSIRFVICFKLQQLP